jgi:hypothetical protein
MLIINSSVGFNYPGETTYEIMSVPRSLLIDVHLLKSEQPCNISLLYEEVFIFGEYWYGNF